MLVSRIICILSNQTEQTELEISSEIKQNNDQDGKQDISP